MADCRVADWGMPRRLGPCGAARSSGCRRRCAPDAGILGDRRVLCRQAEVVCARGNTRLQPLPPPRPRPFMRHMAAASRSLAALLPNPPSSRLLPRPKALRYFQQGKNYARMAQCYYVLEDYSQLEKLVQQLTDDELLKACQRRRARLAALSARFSCSARAHRAGSHSCPLLPACTGVGPDVCERRHYRRCRAGLPQGQRCPARHRCVRPPQPGPSSPAPLPA